MGAVAQRSFLCTRSTVTRASAIFSLALAGLMSTGSRNTMFIPRADQPEAEALLSTGEIDRLANEQRRRRGQVIVAQVRIEALDIAVLPGRPRLDEGGPGPDCIDARPRRRTPGRCRSGSRPGWRAG